MSRFASRRVRIKAWLVPTLQVMVLIGLWTIEIVRHDAAWFVVAALFTLQVVVLAGGSRCTSSDRFRQIRLCSPTPCANGVRDDERAASSLEPVAGSAYWGGALGARSHRQRWEPSLTCPRLSVN